MKVVEKTKRFAVLVCAVFPLLMCIGCAGKLQNPVLEDIKNPGGIIRGYVTHVNREKVLDLTSGNVCDISSDSRYVAVNSNSKAKIIDIETGMSTALDAVESCLSFSPDGKQVLAVGYYGTKFFDSQTGRLIRVVPTTGGLRCVQFSLSCDKILVRDRDEFRVIDLESGKELYSCPHGGFSVAKLIPKSNLLAVEIAEAGLYTDAILRIYDLNSGRIVNEYTLEDRCISGISVSPDGKLIALDTFGSGLAPSTTVEVLTVSDCKKVFSWENVNSVFLMEFAADSKSLVTSSWFRGEASVYDLTNGRMKHVFKAKGTVNGATISPDNRYFAAAISRDGMFSKSGATVVYDMEKERPVLSQVGDKIASGVVFLPNGKGLIASGEDGIRYIPLDALKR